MAMTRLRQFLQIFYRSEAKEQFVMVENRVHFIPSFKRVWNNVVEMLKTSTLALVIGFGIPVASFVLNLIRDLVKRNPDVTMTAVLKDAFFSWSTLVPTFITLASWAYLIVRSYYVTIKSDEAAVSALVADNEAKIEKLTSDVIGYQQAKVDALEQCASVQAKLVSALESLSKANATAQNNSDAFHKQFAETNRLREELERLRTNRRKEEWEKLESKFEQYGGGSNMDIQACWSRAKNTGKLTWFLIGGWDVASLKRFDIVAREAGAFFRSSNSSLEKFAELESDEDMLGAWALAVSEIGGEPLEISGDSCVGGVLAAETGTIKDFPQKSSHACAVLAAQQRAV